MQFVIRDNKDGSWFRCSRLTFKDGTAKWSLRATPYDLFEAYKAEPHRQLINASSDADLKSFVEKWGPIRDKLPPSKEGTDSIAHYQILRNHLAWKADLLSAIERPEQRRAVLARFDPLVKLDGKLIRESVAEPIDDVIARIWSGTEESYFKGPVRADLIILPGVPGCDDGNGSLDESIPAWWLEAASDQEVEDVCIRLATNLNFAHKPAYQVVQQGKTSTLRAAFTLSSLIQALDWMLWQDIYHKRPFLRCAECEHLIPITTKHPKRFCSAECARRQTTREWQRKRREERMVTNGTQKAR